MPFYTYILQSQKNGKFYIGHSADLNDRIERHNSGRSIATKSGVPWILVYQEIFDTKSHAYKRELYFKKQKSRLFIEKLIRSAG